ncbi:hypothetical protein 1013_scaffold47_00080 [Bacteriophage sp.]|nr:hypothetical protein 1013_scaffold47_00080 [Bacteriophage sp.]
MDNIIVLSCFQVFCRCLFFSRVFIDMYDFNSLYSRIYCPIFNFLPLFYLCTIHNGYGLSIL